MLPPLSACHASAASASVPHAYVPRTASIASLAGRPRSPRGQCSHACFLPAHPCPFTPSLAQLACMQRRQASSLHRTRAISRSGYSCCSLAPLLMPPPMQPARSSRLRRLLVRQLLPEPGALLSQHVHQHLTLVQRLDSLMRRQQCRSGRRPLLATVLGFTSHGVVLCIFSNTTVRWPPALAHKVRRCK